MIDADPFDALLDWDEGNASPCSWFGVECSGDGRVIALNLPNLGLKGMLPQEIGTLTHMHSLILYKNSFYGTIPTEMKHLQELKVLDLRYNNFSGPFPSKLRNNLSLKFLFLKGNRFSGRLPVEIHEFTWLDQMSNSVPTARNEENITIRRLLASNQKRSQDNRMLGSATSAPTLALPPPHNISQVNTTLSPRPPPPPVPPPPPSLLPPAPPSEPSPSPIPSVSSTTNQTTSQDNKSKSRSSSTIYASIGLVAFVAVALSAAFFLCYRRRKTSTVLPFSPTTSGQLQATSQRDITSFRRSELEIACEGFSNIIDTLPGFILYKGTLPCGAEIAVVSTLVTYACGWTTISEAQFKNKVEVLSKLNHKNFMNLVGYCEEEEPFTRMMVFEYVSNGTLFEHLHVKEAEQLNWQSRLRTAMGVIYCLNFMQQQNPPVLLRNLSTSCIYLTEDNAAKVSDIRFWGDKKEDEDKPGGYDEYNTVYKFALLLLETISGRRPHSDDDGLLVLWAHRYLVGDNPLMDIVDPSLQPVPEEHVRALTELVKLCISGDLRVRPTVAKVTARMQEITGISEEQAIPRNSPLWWAELEIITSS
ncbi:hypothetical protein GUJ93_ZPchr0033g26866 [Zizania palustris]|nr:hypothetical protein GUJ93_ZPchr0033g26866 [Zizania palustris]